MATCRIWNVRSEQADAPKKILYCSVFPSPYFVALLHPYFLAFLSRTSQLFSAVLRPISLLAAFLAEIPVVLLNDGLPQLRDVF
jgi:hypothetical protein